MKGTSPRTDLRKEMAEYYRPKAGSVELVRLPKMKFLMVDGTGPPEGESFTGAINAIYGTAFSIKFKAKKELKKDFPVMPLEGLWWVKGGGFSVAQRNRWLWTLMIMLPDFVTDHMLSVAIDELRRKGKGDLSKVVRLEGFAEGLCAQTMHIGPYSAEAPTIEMLTAYVKANGYEMVGKHHEIYLGDPRRAAPEKLKTIVRHPVRKVG